MEGKVIECTTDGRKVFKHHDGTAMVMSKYDTEKDAERAVKDLERFLRCLSGQSLYHIMKELAPYREVFAKNCQREYDELSNKK